MDTAIRRQTLAVLLRRSAKRFPRRTAIECGATRWNFAGFDALADHSGDLATNGASEVAVVFTDALPKNPSGKLLKRELRQRYQQRFAEGSS